MRPIDPRLLRCVLTHPRARWLFLGTLLTGVISAAALIVQAIALAQLLTHGVRGALDNTAMLTLSAAVLVRALATLGTQMLASHTATAVKSHLRMRLIESIAARGPEHLAHSSRGEITTLITTGVDALDEYFARYLPSLVTAALVPPSVVVVLFLYDYTAAITVALTLPLMPIFAALIGWATQRYVTRQWRTLTTLAGHFLDVVHGVTTLAIFDRARYQSARIAETTQQHRVHTLRTLRLAFLSSGVLELIATISIALVAVSAGLRLVDAALPLSTALTVLLLTPEAYWPLRNVGAEFHSAHNGVTAAESIFAYNLTAPTQRRGAAVQLKQDSVCEVHEIAVTGRLLPVTVTLPPRSITAITGPSGAGKSTLFSVLLGLTPPTEGSVILDGVKVDTETQAWRSHLAWMPQHAYMVDDTVGQNVLLATPSATSADAERVLATVGLAEMADHAVGERGEHLSSGQRQRVQLARTLLRAETLTNGMVLLDEPTAYLDSDTEETMLRSIAALSKHHRVLVIAHRDRVCQMADRVVRL